MSDEPPAPPIHGGCHTGMPVRKADQPGSGCRSACLHRQLVLGYRAVRHAWEENRERGDHMRLEDDEYRRLYPPPTFKGWLKAHARPLPLEDGAA